MIEYVIFNRELGLFFTGFNKGIFSKYIDKAKLFYSYGYAYDFLNHYKDKYYLNGFTVLSLNNVSKAVLYA